MHCSSDGDNSDGDSGDCDSGDCDDVCMYAGPLLKADKYDVGIPIEFQLELTNNSGQLIIHVLSHCTNKIKNYGYDLYVCLRGDIYMTSIQNGGYFWLKMNYRVYPLLS